MIKEKTTHTTPNYLRTNNGIVCRTRILLLEAIKKHREEFDVECESILRLRCNCGNEIHFKTYDDIPFENVDCDKCGYKWLLQYIGFTIRCHHCREKNRFYNEEEINLNNPILCNFCGKDMR